MARVRRWPEDAEQERRDAIAFFDDILTLAEHLHDIAKRDPVAAQMLALKIQLKAKDGKHTLELARPTKH